MLSKNEWDPLKSVIVGVADNAKIPPTNIGLRCVNYADLTFSEYLGVKHGINCAMLPMRHARTLGGCFHCVTLDLVRDEQ